MMKVTWGAMALAGIVLSSIAAAEESSDKLKVAFGGYVDTYYAYDFNNPAILDRSFTTQPARHNEFNVNLAYIDGNISGDRIRGRVALQAGTSVQSNYAAEGTTGTISGPAVARHIQEARAGYQITDKFWIDAGIFLAHIGFESWISRDNWTYTRSLLADYSPYFETGVKATYQWNEQFATQLLVLNGWQKISETDGNKAIGVQIVYNPTEKITLTYNNFVGNELGTRRRFFNDIIAKVGVTDKLSLAGTYDVGWQQNVDKNSSSLWQGFAVFARYQLTPKFSMTARGEGYWDKDQVLVTTGTPNGFQTTSASLNADLALRENLLWRTEMRGYWSEDNVFPSKYNGLKDTDGLVVMSLTLSI